MFSSYGAVVIQQEHYQDLLREAEAERLIRVAGLQPSNPWVTTQKMIHWLGSQMVKWGEKLESYGLVPLPKVNSMEKIN